MVYHDSCRLLARGKGDIQVIDDLIGQYVIHPWVIYVCLDIYVYIYWSFNSFQTFHSNYQSNRLDEA